MGFGRVTKDAKTAKQIGKVNMTLTVTWKACHKVAKSHEVARSEISLSRWPFYTFASCEQTILNWTKNFHQEKLSYKHEKHDQSVPSSFDASVLKDEGSYRLYHGSASNQTVVIRTISNYLFCVLIKIHRRIQNIYIGKFCAKYLKWSKSNLVHHKNQNPRIWKIEHKFTSPNRYWTGLILQFKERGIRSSNFLDQNSEFSHLNSTYEIDT